MGKIRCNVAIRTDIGTRDEQQDAVETYAECGALAAVICDGMGGMSGGSLASQVASKEMIEIIKKRDEAESIPELFLRSVDILDEKVSSIIDSDGKKMNAGTTIVSVFIKKNRLYWMSVGDSRLYICRGNDMLQATRDHNYFLSLSTQNDEYEPLEEELEKGAALISFIGMGGIEIMDISTNPFELRGGDKLLLTTDGLFKALSDDQICKILSDYTAEKISVVADKLLEAAVNAAPDMRDNISFVLIQTDIQEEKNNETD